MKTKVLFDIILNFNNTICRNVKISYFEFYTKVIILYYKNYETE